MSEFYGRLQGNRGEATRCGSKASGIVVTAESWTSVVRTSMGSKFGGGESIARISIEGKYGGTALSLEFDTDTIAERRDDPRVRAAIGELAKAADAVNNAAQAAQADELERRGKLAREAIATFAKANRRA